MLLSPLPSRPWFRITQRFGDNPDVYAQFGMKGHNGIDFAPWGPGQGGYIVYAPHDGYIKVKNDPNGYGLHVEITSLPYNTKKEQRFSVLAHLSEVRVETGMWVGAGDAIGVMGNTGFSTNTHLHWTYKRLKDGKVQNPQNGYGGAIDVRTSTIQWGNETL